MEIKEATNLEEKALFRNGMIYIPPEEMWVYYWSRNMTTDSGRILTTDGMRILAHLEYKEMLTNKKWTNMLFYALNQKDEKFKALSDMMRISPPEIVATTLKDLEKVSEGEYKATVCEYGTEVERIKVKTGWQYVLDQRFFLPIEGGKEKRAIEGLDSEKKHHGYFSFDFHDGIDKTKFTGHLFTIRNCYLPCRGRERVYGREDFNLGLYPLTAGRVYIKLSTRFACRKN